MLSLTQLIGFGASVSEPVQLQFLEQRTSATDSASYSYTSVSLGTEAADRYIYIMTASGNSSAYRTCTATIAGESATQLLEVQNPDSGFSQIFAFAAHVPSGASGTIDVTWSGTVVRNFTVAWAATKLINPLAVYDSASNITDGNSSKDLTIDALDGGIVLAFINANANPTMSWTNVTERSDAIVETLGGSAADASGLSAGALAVSVVPSSTPTTSIAAAVSLR